MFNKKKDMEKETKNYAPMVREITGEMMVTGEAAKYLGVSKQCLYKWMMRREIPYYKSPTGKLCYFSRPELDAWMQTCRVATAKEIERNAAAWK